MYIHIYTCIYKTKPLEKTVLYVLAMEIEDRNDRFWAQNRLLLALNDVKSISHVFLKSVINIDKHIPVAQISEM